MNSLIFALIGLIGVGLALWGFFWMSKYAKKPTEEDSKKWIENYKKKYGSWNPKLIDLVGGELDTRNVFNLIALIHQENS